MNNMEQLMMKLPSLKHLELHASGNADLVDGQRWQTITNRLITFNFIFYLSADADVEDLDSFRSAFWLNEKHWFVVHTSGCLFSVPHFAETEADEDFQLPVHSTLSDMNIFYKNITQLTLSQPVVDIKHRFIHVQTLAMNYSINVPFIEHIVDLNRIQHLILSPLTTYSGFMLLINQMPNLYRISIRNKIKCFLEEVAGESFQKIRNLEIGYRYSFSRDDEDNDNYNIDQLRFVFPYIEHLHVAHSCSNTEILHLINQFKQLSTASFYCSSRFRYLEHKDNRIIEIQSALNQNRSLQMLDYTYRFDQSSVHIWL